MLINNEIINKYISYFFSEIVNFKNQKVDYIAMNNNEFLSIAMDKIERLTRKHGKLRHRVWSNCYFIFHNGEIEPKQVYENKFLEIKKQYPFLFIRSYLYVIFINIQKEKQNLYINIETNDYKIWYFNSKYEVKEETRRTNFFNISLTEEEIVDDYMYLANSKSELTRMKSANSDAIDCVRAFTGNLELLEQTSSMLDSVRSELENNPQARIILEGPARSGKTIIATILLGEYKDSKFLLMNYFFYQALVDGFHALSGWNTKEIEALVKNPELDFWLNIKKNMPRLLKRIKENLKYAILECDNPKNNSKTKQWLMENIVELTEGFEKIDFEIRDFFVLKLLIDLNSKLSDTTNENLFFNIKKSDLLSIQSQIDYLLLDNITRIHELITKTIEEIIRSSKQKFFHHNINRKISNKVSEGCWIKRGNPTVSKMWSNENKCQLIICDEVQRLGLINEFYNYDEFDEIEQILANSNQSFFVGDNFQMLNYKYDKGINEIGKSIKEKKQSLLRYKLPESVGVPAEIGILMKYLTNPQEVEIDEIVKQWEIEKYFEIVFIENNVDKLISLFDKDKSNKKHIASPLDSMWLYNQKIEIKTHLRKNPIIALSNHEITDFAYKYPYFCNEEIMPNYILSAYELISREVESLYIHIPYFKNKDNNNKNEWYRKHLYVLFTRPTVKLVVNFDVKEEFNQMKSLVYDIKKNGAKLSVSFLST
jgi:hypothetical protein